MFYSNFNIFLVKLLHVSIEATTFFMEPVIFETQNMYIKIVKVWINDAIITKSSLTNEYKI